MNTDTCQAIVERKSSRGIMGRGTESFHTNYGQCSRNALPGGHFCKQHQARADFIEAELAKRKSNK